MLRSLLLLAIFTVFSQNVFASETNRVCRFAYREATIRLIEDIENFKSKKELSKQDQTQALVQLAVAVTNLDLELNIQRGTCRLVESAENRNCVAQYKQIYENVRGRIRTASLISQNQKDVHLTALSTVGIKAKILYRDTLCGYSEPYRPSDESEEPAD